MRKHFVLDTNILLHDPEAIFGFEDNVVVIPIVVIEEIDSFKKQATELGRNAREVARHIDVLREQGNLTEGIPLPSGGDLRVVIAEEKLPAGFHMNHVADDRILSTALHIRERHPEMPVILVTLDTNLRIRANVLGIASEDFDTRGIAIEQLYPDVTTLDVSPEDLGALYDEGSFTLPEGVPAAPAAEGNGTGNGRAEGNGHAPFENEYVMVQQGRTTALARLDIANHRVHAIRTFKQPVWGIRPRNREQHFALDACLSPEIHVVTLVGKAGTGKTLMALAAGLQAVSEKADYQRLLVSRPIFPMGRDIGYLPGDIDAKLKPWMQPIHDNVDFLMTQNQRVKKSNRGVEDLVRQGLLEVEPLTYIRGRSIAQQYMIVDEAQNLTPHEIKTILTRAGEGTKVVFTGDPFQIDNPYVDSISNGLTYLIDRFRGEKIAANITLLKGERSELAELAANLL